MFSLPAENWYRLIIWLVIGFNIYFGYGRYRSVMATAVTGSPGPLAALLGSLPLALGSGIGSELRRPLGITIVGGLLLSQLLTLYTTPVIYIFFDRLAMKTSKFRAGQEGAEPVPTE